MPVMATWAGSQDTQELHFLSVPRRKCSDVLVCGTQEALTLVVILKNGRNH